MAAKDCVLHYFYDPLCGWCYGAEPLVKAVHEAGINVQLHGGGLYDPARKIEPSMAEHIRSNNSSIKSMTGQNFGKPYLYGLLGDPDTVMWSQPTIDAVLAAGKLESENSESAHINRLAMIEAIQSAYYVFGRKVSDMLVLIEIARELGWDIAAFGKKLNPGAAVRHIKETRKLMKTLDISGYPKFILQKEDKTMHKVDHSKYYGKPEKFVKAIRSMT